MKERNQLSILVFNCHNCKHVIALTTCYFLVSFQANTCFCLWWYGGVCAFIISAQGKSPYAKLECNQRAHKRRVSEALSLSMLRATVRICAGAVACSGRASQSAFIQSVQLGVQTTQTYIHLCIHICE